MGNQSGQRPAFVLGGNMGGRGQKSGGAPGKPGRTGKSGGMQKHTLPSGGSYYTEPKYGLHVDESMVNALGMDRTEKEIKNVTGYTEG